MLVKWIEKLVQPNKNDKNAWVWQSIVIFCCFVFGCVCFLPLKSAFQLGGDEGFELVKGLMWSKGFVFYRDIWNDQPPVHTFLLGILFKMFGNEVFVARLLAVFFGGGLLVVFYNLICGISGRVVACVASLFLVAAPEFLHLSASVMLEIPALSLGLFSVWLFKVSRDRCDVKLLIFSGIIMGLAFQTKMISALFLPPMAITLVTSVKFNCYFSSLRTSWQIFSPLLGWFFVVIAITGCIFVVSDETVSLLWGTHFTNITESGKLGTPQDYPFSWLVFKDYLDGVLGVVIALTCICFNRRLRDILFPLGLLITLLFVHSFHRPYWRYYDVHFSIPISWLAGYGIVNTCKWVLRTDFKIRFIIESLFALLFVSICLYSGSRVFDQIQLMTSRGKWQDFKIIDVVKQKSSNTRWFYSDENLYEFYCGLKVPPELTVVPLKRFWVHQITREAICRFIERYQPEQLLLKDGGETEMMLREFLVTHYVETSREETMVLYVSKDIITANHGNGEHP